MNTEFPIPASQLIPQRAPFMMVDELSSFEGKIASSQLTIKPDNRLIDETGKLSAGGIIENMAQTCAARIGYINKFMESKTVKIGVVGSIKNLTIHHYPKVGDVLHTTVEETFSGMLNMTMLNAKVECNNTLIAEGEIKVALTDQESK